MKGQLRKRDPRWRCSDPKHHPADCFCRLTVVRKGHRYIIPRASK